MFFKLQCAKVQTQHNRKCVAMLTITAALITVWGLQYLLVLCYIHYRYITWQCNRGKHARKNYFWIRALTTESKRFIPGDPICYMSRSTYIGRKMKAL